jgi:hypothetical protein
MLLHRTIQGDDHGSGSRSAALVMLCPARAKRGVPPTRHSAPLWSRWRTIIFQIVGTARKNCRRSASPIPDCRNSFCALLNTIAHVEQRAPDVEKSKSDAVGGRLHRSLWVKRS